MKSCYNINATWQADSFNNIKCECTLCRGHILNYHVIMYKRGVNAMLSYHGLMDDVNLLYKHGMLDNEKIHLKALVKYSSSLFDDLSCTQSF